MQTVKRFKAFQIYLFSLNQPPDVLLKPLKQKI